jgi:hypothetical protein
LLRLSAIISQYFTRTMSDNLSEMVKESRARGRLQRAVAQSVRCLEWPFAWGSAALRIVQDRLRCRFAHCKVVAHVSDFNTAGRPSNRRAGRSSKAFEINWG